MSIWKWMIARYLPGVQEAFDMAEAAGARAEASESARQADSARTAALQAENIALRHIQQEMWERFDAAQARADMAQQVMINVEYQRAHGFAPFPNQSKAPDSIDHAMASMDSGFTNGRALVNQGVEDFKRSVREHLGGGDGYAGDDERVSLR